MVISVFASLIQIDNANCGIFIEDSFWMIRRLWLNVHEKFDLLVTKFITKIHYQFAPQFYQFKHHKIFISFIFEVLFLFLSFLIWLPIHFSIILNFAVKYFWAYGCFCNNKLNNGDITSRTVTDLNLVKKIFMGNDNILPWWFRPCQIQNSFRCIGVIYEFYVIFLWKTNKVQFRLKWRRENIDLSVGSA